MSVAEMMTAIGSRRRRPAGYLTSLVCMRLSEYQKSACDARSRIESTSDDSTASDPLMYAAYVLATASTCTRRDATPMGSLSAAASRTAKFTTTAGANVQC